MKKVLLVLLILVIAASGVLMGCQKEQKEKEGEEASVIGTIETPAGQKIKVIFSGPPELEDKWEKIGMFADYEVQVIGSIANKCDRTVEFDQIAFFFDDTQVYFYFGRTLVPGETMEIIARRFPLADAKTFEIRIVGFRKW